MIALRPSSAMGKLFHIFDLLSKNAWMLTNLVDIMLKRSCSYGVSSPEGGTGAALPAETLMGR